MHGAVAAVNNASHKAAWANPEKRLHMLASMKAHKPKVAVDYTHAEWAALTYEEKRAYLIDRI